MISGHVVVRGGVSSNCMIKSTCWLTGVVGVDFDRCDFVVRFISERCDSNTPPGAPRVLRSLGQVWQHCSAETCSDALVGGARHAGSRACVSHTVFWRVEIIG